MKDKLVEVSQNFSRAIVQPIMFLAIPGILLAIGVILKLDFMPQFLRECGSFMYEVMMNSSMNQLSVIICIGLSVSLAKRKKADAAVVAMITFFMFLYANNTWLNITGKIVEPTALGLLGSGQAMVLGIQVVDMGVFLGILLGCIIGYVFNKYEHVKFPDIVSIYGGARFVLLILAAVSIILGISMAYIWPFINHGITAAATFIAESGNFGVFIYGLLNRLLIPTGMHHLVNMPFLFTPLGGTAVIAGEPVVGAAMIWYAQVGNLAQVTQIDESVRFLTIGFSKIFGCAGIALAMIKTAKPEKKQAMKGLIIPSLFVALLAGITEPFEFTFLFVSPMLWVVHSFLDGIFQMLLWILGSRTPVTNGIISLITGNLPIPMHLNKIYILLALGVVGVATWYFIFVFLINKFNIKTPGREDDEPTIVEGVIEVSNTENGIEVIIEGLGGAANIDTLTNCFSRLRVEVLNVDLVDEAIINKYKNKGIVRKGNNIQIVFGTNVQSVREEVAFLLGIE